MFNFKKPVLLLDLFDKYNHLHKYNLYKSISGIYKQPFHYCNSEKKMFNFLIFLEILMKINLLKI